MTATLFEKVKGKHYLLEVVDCPDMTNTTNRKEYALNLLASFVRKGYPSHGMFSDDNARIIGNFEISNKTINVYLNSKSYSYGI